jgi:hypothetical protein
MTKRKHSKEEAGDTMVVKKMVLVPPDKVVPEYRLKHKAYRAPFQPDRNQLAVLDEEMSEILKEKPTSADGYDRAQRYQDALEKFLVYFKKLRTERPVQRMPAALVSTAAVAAAASPPPPSRRKAGAEEARTRGLERAVKRRSRQLDYLGVNYGPKSTLNRTQQLLDKLNEAGLSWHEASGRVRYPDGTVERDVNIVDLIHDVVDHQKRAGSPPPAARRFYKFLGGINVPSMVIGTRKRRDWYNQQNAARRIRQEAAEDPYDPEDEEEEEEEEEAIEEAALTGVSPLFRDSPPASQAPPVSRKEFDAAAAETFGSDS